MTQALDTSLLRKKAEAGKNAADGPPMSAERAIGQALARVAEARMNLPLSLRALRETRMTLADLPEVLEDLSMLAVLDGPQEGLGLMLIPPPTLSALIEMQTMGRLSKLSPPPRRPTRIDAAMVADFVDDVLISIEEALATHEDVIWAGGFRYASYLDDPRPIGLMFEEISYRVWSAELAFGAEGDRLGGLLWVVPAVGRGPQPRRPTTGEEDAPIIGDAPQREAEEWSKRLERSVMNAPATIEAVLHRVTLPLASVLGFRPGLEIPVPLAALEALRIEGEGRRFLVQARLGQHSGMRAVRLCEPGEEDRISGSAPRTGGAVGIDAGVSPFAALGPRLAPEPGGAGGPPAPDRAPSVAHDADGPSGLDKSREPPENLPSRDAAPLLRKAGG